MEDPYATFSDSDYVPSDYESDSSFQIEEHFFDDQEPTNNENIGK